MSISAVDCWPCDNTQPHPAHSWSTSASRYHCSGAQATLHGYPDAATGRFPCGRHRNGIGVSEGWGRDEEITCEACHATLARTSSNESGTSTSEDPST